MILNIQSVLSTIRSTFFAAKGKLRLWSIDFICLFLGEPEDHTVIYSSGVFKTMIVEAEAKNLAKYSAPLATPPDQLALASPYALGPSKYATHSKYERRPEYVRRTIKKGPLTEEEAKNIPLKPNLAWRLFLPLRNRLTAIEFFTAIWSGCSKYYCLRMHRYLMATPIVELTDEEFDLVARYYATYDKVKSPITAEFFERNDYTIEHYDIREYPLTLDQKRFLKLALKRDPTPNRNDFFQEKSQGENLTPAEFNARNQAPNEQDEYAYLDDEPDVEVDYATIFNPNSCFNTNISTLRPLENRSGNSGANAISDTGPDSSGFSDVHNLTASPCATHTDIYEDDEDDEDDESYELDEPNDEYEDT